MKRVLILGKGKSGDAAFDLLIGRGVSCVLVDDKTPVFGESELSSFCFAVVSPGISPCNKWVTACVNSGLKIVSELDLGLWHLRSKNIIAITGTNGKTTCVKLLESLLLENGNCYALGNVGTPLCEKVNDIKSQEKVVLEVSSFMLAQSKLLAPHIAILTNITPDHAEWHGGFAEYKNAKLSLFKNQTGSDFAILNADDPCFSQYKKCVKAQLFSVSINKKVKGCYIRGKNIIFNNGHIHEIVASTKDINLVGKHNLTNVLMCVLAAKLCGVDSYKIRHALLSFTGLPNRLKLVANINGVQFVNDSKSTNQDSTIVAVAAFKNNVTLLLGGYDKGIDITIMFKKLKKRVKHFVVYGACREKFYQDAKRAKIKSVAIQKSLKEAFFYAAKITKRGGTVLLSPATSSFDQFKNYSERGEYFEQLVKEFEQTTTEVKTD